MTITLERLGKELKDARLAKNINQETMSEEAQLHRTYIGGIERGERNLSFNALQNCAKAAGFPKLSDFIKTCEA